MTTTEIFWFVFPMAFIVSNVIGWTKFADWYLDRQNFAEVGSE